MKGQPLGGFGSDAGQFAEFFDGLLDLRGEERHGRTIEHNELAVMHHLAKNRIIDKRMLSFMIDILRSSGLRIALSQSIHIDSSILRLI